MEPHGKVFIKTAHGQFKRTLYLFIGGVFQVRLSFTEEFNYKPPEIHFMTIPFHPNGTVASTIMLKMWRATLPALA